MLTRYLKTSAPKFSNPLRLPFLRPDSHDLPSRSHVSSAYFLKDTNSDCESERLDVQHRLVMRMMDHSILHPSIPQNPQRIADVATGNGTWLLELQQRFKPSNKVKFHGFDLTPRLLPKIHGRNLDFSIHDFYNPFPREHRGKYDVVHVRFLMGAIQTSADLQTAVTNIAGLLKPGGYLQWEEYDLIAQLDEPKTAPNLTLWRSIVKWVQGRGYQLRLAEDASQALAGAGMDPVDHEYFSSAAFGRFDDDLRLTLFYALEVGIPMVYTATRSKSPEVLAQVERDVDMCREEINRGNVVDYFLDRIVFRKPLD